MRKKPGLIKLSFQVMFFKNYEKTSKPINYDELCILRRHEQTGDFSRYAANTNTEDLNYSVQTINRKYKKCRDGKFLQKQFQIKLFFNSLFYFFLMET